mmetsp:Transcript_58157/g.107088  ORF Transcript_58157/g.107088 Transcript_58157/m.107088 type:complete len:209 (-) Transcript_58157:70-696(-)
MEVEVWRPFWGFRLATILTLVLASTTWAEKPHEHARRQASFLGQKPFGSNGGGPSPKTHIREWALAMDSHLAQQQAATVAKEFSETPSLSALRTLKSARDLQKSAQENEDMAVNALRDSVWTHKQLERAKALYHKASNVAEAVLRGNPRGIEQLPQVRHQHGYNVPMVPPEVAAQKVITAASAQGVSGEEAEHMLQEAEAQRGLGGCG